MADEPEDRPRADGTIRRAHYGSGRQPWDDIVEAGWGPHFAAGNVLKYLRRDKNEAHSLESARWYYERLKEGSAGRLFCNRGPSGINEWQVARLELVDMLTEDERTKLGVPT